VTSTDQLLAELAPMLRGPRRARQRLLDEIREDLHDAVAAQRHAGVDASTADKLVATRFGSTHTLAARWNRDRAERSGAVRRNLALVLLAAVTAGALAITQYASGKNPPARPPCARSDLTRPCTGKQRLRPPTRPPHRPTHAAFPQP